MKTNHLRNILALASLLLWSAAPPSQAATNLVRIGNYWFDPTNIIINAGDTVRWSNAVVTAHDTTSETGLWASPTFSSPNSYSFKFTNAGYYPYICAVHIIARPEQTGTVTVVSIANVPPTVAITNPPNGAVLTAPASFSLAASASDANGTVSQVEFFNGAGSLGVDTTSPYSVAVGSLNSGNYTFSAVATDNNGAKATNSISLTVNAPPTVSLSSPTNETSFAAPANITVAATANDSDGSVTNVEFFNGAAKLGTDTTNPYSFAWNNVAAGNYTLTAKATDNRGATATSVAVTISVTNSPPTPVTILSPMMYGSEFAFSFATQSGRSYTVQFTPTIQPANWQVLTNFTGNGSNAYVRDANYTATQRFYRVGAQ